MNIGNNDPESGVSDQQVLNFGTNINPSVASSNAAGAPLLQEEQQQPPLPNVQIPQKHVYDFRKNSKNY